MIGSYIFFTTLRTGLTHFGECYWTLAARFEQHAIWKVSFRITFPKNIFFLPSSSANFKQLLNAASYTWEVYNRLWLELFHKIFFERDYFKSSYLLIAVHFLLSWFRQILARLPVECWQIKHDIFRRLTSHTLTKCCFPQNSLNPPPPLPTPSPVSLTL
jgi:hypothetical protein